MENIFKISLVQGRSSGSRSENLDKTLSGVRAAAKAGAQIVFLQELFNSNYFCTTQVAENFDLAESLNGETIQTLQEVSKELDLVIVAPFFEKRASGLYHNSAAVIDAGGKLLGVYRKMHIPDDPLYYEKYYFTPGEAEDGAGGFKVFKTKYANIGVLICWDQWYPEAARITSLLGAEILFYPTAIGWHPSEKAEFGKKQLDAWQTIQRSHAIANGVYVASCNRVGHEMTEGTDGIEFFGSSFVADPFGEVIAQASSSEEEILFAKCSRLEIEETRRNWPFLRDRRIDAYGKIKSRVID